MSYLRSTNTVCSLFLSLSVPTFEASEYKVTNGEFLEFVESGGYHQRELWTDEGERKRNKERC